MNECVYVIRNLLVMHGCQAAKNVGGLASQTSDTHRLYAAAVIRFSHALHGNLLYQVITISSLLGTRHSRWSTARAGDTNTLRI